MAKKPKKPGVHIVRDNLPQLAKGLKQLPRRDVLVGYPAETTERTNGVMTNAAIAYIHEHGAPGANIPARPSLYPGVRDATKETVPQLKAAARATLDGKIDLAEKHLEAAGLIAADSVRMKIRTGPFAPLAPATIRARRRRTPGSTYRRKATTAAEVTPLIDTAQMLRAVTHVVRDKGATE